MLGRLRIELAKSLEDKDVNVRGDDKKMNFLWVTDFPLFSKGDGDGKTLVGLQKACWSNNFNLLGFDPICRKMALIK